MKIQVQFPCPVGLMIDTDTGAIEKVIVWDDHLDTTEPAKAYQDEYFPATDAAKAAARSKGSYATGHSVFEELPLEHPEVAKALEVIRDNEQEWPAWQFGA